MFAPPLPLVVDKLTLPDQLFGVLIGALVKLHRHSVYPQCVRSVNPLCSGHSRIDMSGTRTDSSDNTSSVYAMVFFGMAV
jgi:hypothetical protein